MSADLQALNTQAIQAAKRHMNHVAWPTVLLTGGVLAALAATLWLYAQGLLPVWAATLLVAALTYMSYTPLHEAAHGNVHGGREGLRWLNDVCGYLVAPIIAVPYASHTVEHFTHHRHTNQPDKDPDYIVSNFGRGPLKAFCALFQFLWVQNSFFARHYWPKATPRERGIYLLELALSLGWRVAAIALLAQAAAATLAGAMVVVLLGYLLGGLFTAYWFAYRPHIPYENPARYQNTNSLIMPRWMKPFEWFWLGQNLHSVHHLFPRVPFYRYHALHREIEPILRAHGTPIVGIFSRRPLAAGAGAGVEAGAGLGAGAPRD